MSGEHPEGPDGLDGADDVDGPDGQDGADGAPEDAAAAGGQGPRRRRRRRRRRGAESAAPPLSPTGQRVDSPPRERIDSPPRERIEATRDLTSEVDSGWDTEPAPQPVAAASSAPVPSAGAGDDQPASSGSIAGEPGGPRKRRRRRRGRDSIGAADAGARAPSPAGDDPVGRPGAAGRSDPGARPEARDRADRGGRRDGGGRPDPAAARRDGPGRPDPGGAPRDGGRPVGDSRRDVSSRRDGGGRRDASGRDPGGRRDGRDPAARRDASGRPDPSPRRDASGRPDPSARRDASGRPDPSARRDASGRPDPARRDRPPRPDAGTRPPRAIAPPPDDDAETTWPRAASFASDDDPTSSGERRASSDEAWGDDADAPTADVVLAADLPSDPPADDPDPSTAFLDDPDRDEPGDDRRGQGGIRSVVGVKFTTAGKIYLFDAGDDSFAAGEDVVVDSERGPRVGRVAVAPLRQDVGRSGPLRRVLRRPTRGDERRLDANRERAEAALRAAKSTARELGLPIKVFHAELSLGGSKALIYYSSDDKVDARRLLRDLSQKLHLRIELRQTGVRDEAKMVGGIGSCGQELCCTTWLPAFVPVSIKNAKDQGLVLNPTKVSGQCGRLKCCLVYEQATYAELRRGLPKLGKRVVTASGEGRVVEVDVLRQRVRVSLMGGVVEIFAAGEVQPLFPSQAGGRPDDQPG